MTLSPLAFAYLSHSVSSGVGTDDGDVSVAVLGCTDWVLLLAAQQRGRGEDTLPWGPGYGIVQGLLYVFSSETSSFPVTQVSYQCSAGFWQASLERGHLQWDPEWQSLPGSWERATGTGYLWSFALGVAVILSWCPRLLSQMFETRVNSADSILNLKVTIVGVECFCQNVGFAGSVSSPSKQCSPAALITPFLLLHSLSMYLYGSHHTCIWVPLPLRNLRVKITLYLLSQAVELSPVYSFLKECYMHFIPKGLLLFLGRSMWWESHFKQQFEVNRTGRNC